MLPLYIFTSFQGFLSHVWCFWIISLVDDTDSGNDVTKFID